MKDIVISRRKDDTYDLVYGDEKKKGVDYSDMIRWVKFWTTMPKRLPKKSRKDKEPKDGDFLVFTLDNGGVFYLIFYELDAYDDAIKFNFCVNKTIGKWYSHGCGYTLCPREHVKDIRPMTNSEIEWFIEFMRRVGYLWDEKNKSVVKCEYAPYLPHEGEECFYVTEDRKIESKPFHYYDKNLRDLAWADNCFVERRDAEKFLKEMLKKEE